MERVVCKLSASPEVVVWDNVMTFDMFNFFFNDVEFTQGELRIARDTTVNEYVFLTVYYCEMFRPIFHTQVVDKWHV